MSKIGLRYAAAEGGLISIIDDDSDPEMDRVVLNPGEALAKVERAEFITRVTARPAAERHRVPHEMLREITGKTPPDPRLAIVDDATNEVRGALIGYPSTLTAPAGIRLMRHATAEPGDTLTRAGVLTRRIVAEA